ncbi:MAG: Spy/CpxP family protein refolding chaperone [Motiliproteus sp.]|jgi:Spy/CpxP family protein refolding chaperone
MNKGLLIAVTALVLGSGAAYAANGSGPNGCDSESHGGKESRHGGMRAAAQTKDPEQMQQRMLDRLGQRLGLTEAQRQQIGEVLDPVDMQAMHAQMQEIRTQMQDLDPAAATYLDQVEVMAKQKAALMSQQMLEQATQHAKIFALLTPEQQEAFQKMKSHRGDREGRHHRS